MADAATASLRKQLQVDDPSSPANGLLSLLKGWTNWRAAQSEAPPEDQMSFTAPGGGGLASLMGILRDAAGKPMRMFHGTRAAFDEFSNAKADPKALYEKGHYFTAAPELSGEYAFKGSQEARDTLDGLRALQEMKAVRPDAAAGIDAMIQQKGEKLRRIVETEPDVSGANIRPAYLDIKKPFDMDAPAAEDVTRGLIGWRGADAPNAKNNEVYEALIGSLGSKAKANELLRDLGYDGITHTGGNIMGSRPHKVGIAWDPKQILPPWKLPE